MKRTWKQLGSLFLSVCMVLTMLPMTAFAETGDTDSGTPLGASGTITAFGELDTKVSKQTVKTGTPEKELKLPGTLAVTVSESVYDIASGSDATKQDTQTTVAVSSWTADPAYDGNTEGDYIFTPALDLRSGLTVAEGAKAPQITVIVEAVSQQARGEVSLLAADDIAIDATNFPDGNFLNWLKNQAYGSDSILTAAEIAGITSLNVLSKSIASLAGIEHFTSLTELICSKNQLTALPAALPTGLTTLDCSYNQLTALPATLPTGLTTLDCSINQLTALPATLPTGLTKLICSSNQLTALPATLPNGLANLNCYDNQLTVLPALPSGLTTLECSDNQLTVLPTLPAGLTALYCYANQLTVLPTLPAGLTTLDCSSNKLTVLDISALSELKVLNCSQNRLTGLALNSSADYTSINVKNNHMASNAAVTGKIINWDSSSYFKFSPQYGPGSDIADDFADANFKAAVYGAIGKTAPAAILDTDVAGFISLDVSGKSIASLAGIQHFTGLTELNCSFNQLTTLPTLPTGMTKINFSGNQLMALPTLPTGLTQLDCSDNQLMALPTLPGGLTQLTCSGNQLMALPTLPGGLTQLHCYGNQLTVLPTLPSSLTELDCSGNQLASLPELPSGLTQLDCGGNQLTVLPVLPSGLTHLTCPFNQLATLPVLPSSLTQLDCGGNQLTVLNVSALSALESLMCFQNRLTGLVLNGSAPYSFVKVNSNYMESNAAVTGKTITWDDINFIFEPQHTAEFKAVTDIIGIPLAATVGTPLTLSGTVFPSDATNKTIIWGVLNPGTTGATILGDIFTATSAGTAEIYASITNGSTIGERYQKHFAIIVTAGGSTVPVTVTTAADLKAALEGIGTAPIELANDITVTNTIYLGANHELRVPSDKTLSFTGTGRIQFGAQGTPVDHTLTINGGGTLDLGVGTYRIGSYNPIRANPTSYGTVNLSNINVKIFGNGFCVRNLDIGNGAKITSEGERIGTTITIDSGRTCTVSTGGSVDVKNHGTAGILLEGTLHINGGTVTLGQGNPLDPTDFPKPSIEAAPGSTLKYTAGMLTGTAGSYIYLNEGAKVQSISGKFSDWGNAFTASGEVTVGAYGTPTSATGLTEGFYLWDATNNVFAQHGITVSQEPQNTSVTAGSINGTLSVAATASNGQPITYQWYVSNVPTDYWQNGTPITGTNTNTFTIPTNLTAGTYYFYCSFTASGCLNVVSDLATVTVTDPTVTTYPLTVIGGMGSGSYKENAQIAITAGTAPSGKMFDKWELTSGGGTLTDAGSSTTTYTMPANAATVTVTYKNAPVTTYTITASAGSGGSISPNGAQTVNSGDSKTFAITPYRNYNIASVTVDGVNQGAISSYTFSNVTANHTISATFNYSNGGSTGDGNTGGGSPSGGTTTTTPDKKPDQPVTAMAPVTATAGANGSASAAIPDKAVTDAIAKAQADAKVQGKTANGISVGLNVTMPKGSTSLTATLTQSSLNSLVSAGVSQLELNGAPVSLGLDLKALQEIQKQSSGSISITIALATGLSKEAKTLLGNRPVYSIIISYVKDGKTVNVTGLGSGTATLSIPYTPGKNETVGYLFGVYVDAKGKAQRIPGSAYDANSGSLLIPTGHFSVYGVGYTTPSAKFTDIGSHWGKEAIDYVVGRGLLSGTSETTFAPNTSMTRGMLVTALGRLAGVDVKVYTTNSFSDVKADSAFRPYIEWAYKKGIVQGIGNQQFAPDRAITREEIAVIFANYAKTTGYKLPVTREATAYADASSIGNDYKAAVTAMQQAGIMMAGTDNKFNPKSNATRAEVSSMLHRYIKLTIDPATAQGWALDDAGQWLYYKDGKALTGAQTIDGVKYFFETTGVLKSGWVKDGDNWRHYSGNKAAMGWLDIGDKRYYFTKDGLMVSRTWLQIDGKWYYFYADGTLAKNTKVMATR